MEKKYHKILKSKEPSLVKMQKMTENLRMKSGDYAKVNMEAWAFSNGGNEIGFHISAGPIYESFKTWSGLLEGYHKIMNDNDGGDIDYGS